MDCLFCQFANKEKEAELVYEDGGFVAFKDIAPKAPVHILVVPKEHIGSVSELEEKHAELAGGLLLAARKTAEQQGLAGYKLQFNVGRQGGQVIDHLHLHLLGNPAGPVPGTLV